MAERQVPVYRLDPRNERLYRGRTCVHVTRKAFDLLCLLISNPDRLLTKQQILDEIWPGLHVSEGMVKEYIHDIRMVLKDDPANPCFIETVRGRGYRYLGGIELVPYEAGSGGPSVKAEVGRQLQRSYSEAPREPSVAVLPFANLSGDRLNGRRSVIFTEGVTSDLSRFRDLAVISQHSSYRFRLGQLTPAEIGCRLGVCYLVAGSIRSAGKRVRAAVELIETSSQRVLWSDCLIVETAELVDLQHEVSGAVAARLGVQIEADLVQAQLSKPGAEDAQGLISHSQALVRRFSRRGNAEAFGLLQRALEVAPNSSRAYRVLSRAHTYKWLYGWSPTPEQSRAAALECARQAIRCDPLDARAFAELGVAFLHRRQMNEAVAEFERATSLNPNDPDILVEFSDALKYIGKGREALTLIERAMRLNPYFPDWYLWYMADAYDALGKSAEVVSTAERMQDATEASRLVAANLAHLGMLKEAERRACEVLQAHPGFRVGAWRRRQPWFNGESAERFFDGLRRAGLPE